MAKLLTVLLAAFAVCGLLATPLESEVPPSALVGDDACSAEGSGDAAACALNALQQRGKQKIAGSSASTMGQNKSGHISPSFDAWLKYDKDADGALDRTEISQLVGGKLTTTLLGHNLTELFKVCDQDRSGKINRTEFSLLMATKEGSLDTVLRRKEDDTSPNLGVGIKEMCFQNPKCQNLGLVGKCCPTDDGVLLDCCSMPSTLCSAHAACSAQGLVGSCCPTNDGVMLSCCKGAAACALNPGCTGLTGDCCPTGDGVMLACCR